MMTIHKTVYQGDEGSSISATLTQSNGTPVDLTDAVEVRFIMQPDVNSPAIIDADPTTGKVVYDLQLDDVDTPGDYKFNFQVEWLEGPITYPSSGPMTLRVLPSLNPPVPPTTTTPLVTVDEAYLLTGSYTTDQALMEAQIQISTYLDRDLTDQEWLDSLSKQDMYRLEKGIAYQAVCLTPAEDGSGSNSSPFANLPPGVRSVSQGDISISFADDATGGSGGASLSAISAVSGLCVLTTKILDKLSWRKSIRTITPVPMHHENEDHVWTTEEAFYGPIVRPALDPYGPAYWKVV